MKLPGNSEACSTFRTHKAWLDLVGTGLLDTRPLLSGHSCCNKYQVCLTYSCIQTLSRHGKWFYAFRVGYGKALKICFIRFGKASFCSRSIFKNHPPILEAVQIVNKNRAYALLCYMLPSTTGLNYPRYPSTYQTCAFTGDISFLCFVRHGDFGENCNETII